MLDGLHRRFKERQAAAERLQAQADAQAARLKQIVERAGVMDVLLDDPRYHEYRQLLEEAREACVNELVALTVDADGRDAFLHQVARLQGRLYQLDLILKTPQTFFALAESDTAIEASRQSASNGTARLAASAR